ncbi:MAG: hypothetical protein K2P84_10650 [Undibacterium sp.]|nr:hypothetical protein [Undibacterium sp.]
MWKFLAKVIFSVSLASLGYCIFDNLLPGKGAIGIVLTANFWARLFSYEVIDLVLWFKHRGEYSALFRWHGSYYSFDGQHIRFYLVEDVVWVALSDIERLFEPVLAERELRLLAPAYGPIPEQKFLGVTEQGLLVLLKSRTESRHASYRMIRFKRWLLTQALPNVRRLPRSAVSHSQK